MWKTLVNGDILEITLLAEPLFLFVERALMANGKAHPRLRTGYGKQMVNNIHC